MICKIKSYAKINLNLKVIKRKKNGYHKLKTIMSVIDLHDNICFTESDKIIVNMNPEYCGEKDNLCYRVAVYMKKYTNDPRGIRIDIVKRIPVGGGLGGGSSNAAAVLLFLNKYWNINFSFRKLKKIAFSFGADIPFFITGNQCFVSGCGEKVKPIKKAINGDVILLVPPFGLKTKDVFERWDSAKKRANSSFKYSDLYNDLEGSANAVSNNQINNYINRMSKLGEGKVLMSGSGSTIVYYVNQNESCEEVYKKIRNEFSECEVFCSKIKPY